MKLHFIHGYPYQASIYLLSHIVYERIDLIGQVLHNVHVLTTYTGGMGICVET